MSIMHRKIGCTRCRSRYQAVSILQLRRRAAHQPWCEWSSSDDASKSWSGPTPSKRYKWLRFSNGCLYSCVTTAPGSSQAVAVPPHLARPGHGRRLSMPGLRLPAAEIPAVPFGPWMLFTSSHQFYAEIVRHGRCGSPRGAAGPAAAWRCRCGWPRLRLAPPARSPAATPPPAALQHAVKTSGAAPSLASDTVDILPIEGGPSCSHKARLLLLKLQSRRARTIARCPPLQL